jgi:hypothetical protein
VVGLVVEADAGEHAHLEHPPEAVVQVPVGRLERHHPPRRLGGERAEVEERLAVVAAAHPAGQGGCEAGRRGLAVRAADADHRPAPQVEANVGVGDEPVPEGAEAGVGRAEEPGDRDQHGGRGLDTGQVLRPGAQLPAAGESRSGPGSLIRRLEPVRGLEGVVEVGRRVVQHDLGPAALDEVADHRRGLQAGRANRVDLPGGEPVDPRGRPGVAHRSAPSNQDGSGVIRSTRRPAFPGLGGGSAARCSKWS